MDILENMEVVDANDQHVGIVGKVEGERIMLKEAIDAQHPFVERNQVACVEGNKVKLSQQTSAITTCAFVSRNG